MNSDTIHKPSKCPQQQFNALQAGAFSGPDPSWRTRQFNKIYEEAKSTISNTNPEPEASEECPLRHQLGRTSQMAERDSSLMLNQLIE